MERTDLLSNTMDPCESRLKTVKAKKCKKFIKMQLHKKKVSLKILYF